MKSSRDHIVTSHAGSLPRPDNLIEANRAREAGETKDERAFQALLGSAVVDVVKQLKRRGDFTLVTFDAEPTSIVEMADGNLDCMIVQNPYQMGYQGVRLLKALVADDKATIAKMFPNLGKPEGNVYDTGIKVVVPDEGSPLKKDMFDKKTEFLKLSDFRHWLEKYQLTGS